MTFADTLQKYDEMFDLTLSQRDRYAALCRILDQYTGSLSVHELSVEDAAILIKDLRYLQSGELTDPSFDGRALRYRHEVVRESISTLTWRQHVHALSLMFQDLLSVGVIPSNIFEKYLH